MRIESYSFGRMVIAGREYRRDLCLVAGRVLPDWWRREGHLLQLVDLEPLLAAAPAVLVVGRGAYGVMKIADEVVAECDRRGITLHEAATAAAVKTYNDLLGESGQRLAAAFHLTC